jgi:hypothetical protein
VNNFFIKKKLKKRLKKRDSHLFQEERVGEEVSDQFEEKFLIEDVAPLD